MAVDGRAKFPSNGLQHQPRRVALAPRLHDLRQPNADTQAWQTSWHDDTQRFPTKLVPLVFCFSLQPEVIVVCVASCSLFLGFFLHLAGGKSWCGDLPHYREKLSHVKTLHPRVFSEAKVQRKQVQILCYCTYINFWGTCALSMYFSDHLLTSFLHKYLYLILLTKEKHSLLLLSFKLLSSLWLRLHCKFSTEKVKM